MIEIENVNVYGWEAAIISGQNWRVLQKSNVIGGEQNHDETGIGNHH